MSGPEVAVTKVVSRVQIARYAAATGDFNALHLDDEHARGAGFPGVIAHGLLTLGFAGQAVTDWCAGDPGRVRSISMRFRKPVLPGQTITVQIQDMGSAGAATQRLDLDVRCGDVLVASGSAVVAE